MKALLAQCRGDLSRALCTLCAMISAHLFLKEVDSQDKTIENPSQLLPYHSLDELPLLLTINGAHANKFHFNAARTNCQEQRVQDILLQNGAHFFREQRLWELEAMGER